MARILSRIGHSFYMASLVVVCQVANLWPEPTWWFAAYMLMWGVVFWLSAWYVGSVTRNEEQW